MCDRKTSPRASNLVHTMPHTVFSILALAAASAQPIVDVKIALAPGRESARTETETVSIVVHHLVADGATLADAWEATSAARPEARPIPAFRAQLCKAEARLHGGAQTTDETLARAQHPQRGKRNSLTKDGCVVA